MNWLDIVLIIFIGIAVFLGLKNGLIKAVLALVGIVVGITLAGHYYIPLSERLTFISSESAAKAVAFALIVLGVMAVAALLAALLNKLASALLLGWINRIGGAVLGLVFASLLAGAVLAIWINYLGTPETVSNSFVAAILLKYAPLVLGLLPKEFDGIRNFFM